MDNQQLSTVIGRLYEAASDPERWPDALQALALAMDTTLDEGDRPGEFLDRLLRPHLDQALSLSHRETSRQAEGHLLQRVWDRLPLAIALVDSQCRVLASNQGFEVLTEGPEPVRVVDGLLSTPRDRDGHELCRLVREVCAAADDRVRTLGFESAHMGASLSAALMAWHERGPGAAPRHAHQALVVFASPALYADIPGDVLRSVYGLTEAEARLVAALVEDRSPGEIAEAFGLSQHTVRAQLRAVFHKTGTHRQAELVRQVVAGPAMVATLTRAAGGEAEGADGSCSHRAPSLLRQDQRMRLSDGRMLGYAEYGPSSGAPVVLMHSVLGSRLQRHPDEGLVRQCGVRLIVPDRAGTGLSDAAPSSTLASWSTDVAQLADHLGIDRFGVVGYSMGGAYAAACAHWLGARVARLVLVCTTLPFRDVRDLRGMYVPFRALLTVARSAPTILGPLLHLLFARFDPRSLQREMAKQMPPVDRALLFDEAFERMLSKDIDEATRQGTEHVITEVEAICGDWGFDMRKLQQPISLWHGERDRVVPLHLIQNLAASVPGARTHYEPNAGHFLLFHSWTRILLEAADKREGGAQRTTGIHVAAAATPPPARASTGRGGSLDS